MLTFAATRPDESAEIGRFLQDVFQTPPEHVPFRADVLQWKAWEPHPLWEGSRSYVYRQDGQIVAHGCVTPMECMGPSGTVRTACVVDWAASSRAPGAGVLLFRKLAQLRDGLSAVGGSDDTRNILPRLGFQVRCPMYHLVRVIRPVRHHWQPRRRDWKSGARAGRDMWRNRRRLPQAPTGWTVRPVRSFDDEVIGGLLPRPGETARLVSRRSAALLNYWMNCPAVPMEGYIAWQDTRPAGYFLLSRAHEECRIVDFGAQPADEASVLALAWDRAAATTATTRVRWSVTIARQRDLALDNGLVLESEEPVFYWNTARRPEAAEADFSMTLADNDYFYLP